MKGGLCVARSDLLQEQEYPRPQEKVTKRPQFGPRLRDLHLVTPVLAAVDNNSLTCGLFEVASGTIYTVDPQFGKLRSFAGKRTGAKMLGFAGKYHEKYLATCSFLL